MQLFKKKAYTLYYEDVIPEGPTLDAILWDFSYVSTPYTTSHILSISAPGNSSVNASVTSNGVITTWVGSTINIEVLAATGDASEVYSLITVTRQLRVSPYTTEPVNTIGGDCIVTNNNINLTIPDYDPAYQYTISGVVEPCTIPWNSLTAAREPAVISSSSDAFIVEACGFNLTGTLPDFFIATQIPGVLSIGDRVFMSDLPGVVPFDGTKLGVPNYWALYLTEGIEACTFGLNQVALIDEQGFIIEVQCCSV